MSESETNDTNNTETTKSAYSVKEYIHGANIVFPDGIERGFFPNTAYHGRKDGAALAQKIVDGLNELDYLRTKLDDAEQVNRALRADLDGTVSTLRETEAKLAAAEERLATIAAATNG